MRGGERKLRLSHSVRYRVAQTFAKISSGAYDGPKRSLGFRRFDAQSLALMSFELLFGATGNHETEAP